MTTIAHSSSARSTGFNSAFTWVLPLLFSAALVIGALEFAARGTHTMVAHTLSELFYAPGGFALFPAAVILLACSILGWAWALFRRQLPRTAAVAAVGGIGLVIAAIFPTDPSATEVLSWSAQIHRYAAAVMFIFVPLAGLAHLRSAKLRTGARGIIFGAVVLSALGALPAIGGRLESLMPPGVWSDLFGGFAAACGLVERLQLLLVIAIIATSTQALTQPSYVRKTATPAVHKQQ